MFVKAFIVIFSYLLYNFFSVQSKLTDLYQSACQESERKVEELAKALEQLQAMVSEVEDERDGYATTVKDLENK